MMTPLSPAPAPVSAVPIGPSAPKASGGWATQLARLVRWELFLAWRRRGMIITLSALLLVGYAIVELFTWLSWVGLSDYPEAQDPIATLLTFPASISTAGQYFGVVGTLFLIVLAGALVGSEYSFGTHRLSLARGVGRGQLVAAQVIAVAILALIASGATLLLGSIVGAFGSVALGAGAAPSVSGIGELLVYWLAVALNAFAYALIALWIGTLGRSVAGAIAGPLVYIFVEVVATSLLGIFKFAPRPDALTRFISSIPDYLLGANASEVVQLSGQAPYRLLEHTRQLGWAHSLIVVAVYCALFIVSAYLVFRGRDARE
ncbi:MAG TPA: ABC transporter permease [Ktedonobacterales bacterium]|nr:ABC transporter permease [Ktedonobacterales bacterium]